MYRQLAFRASLARLAECNDRLTDRIERLGLEVHEKLEELLGKGMVEAKLVER